MKIGLTKSNTGFSKYIEWLEYFNFEYEILDWENKNDFEKFEECKALILTGGADIYPEFFCDWSNPEDKVKYLPERDGFEFKLLEKTIEKKIPVLGICRGCQLINVYFRGNLIFDLELIRNVNHRKISESENRIHEINVIKNSLLWNITDCETGKVTSSHHQAIDRIGEGLMINAKAPDGVVEGIEYSDKSGKGFLLGIQFCRFCNFNSIC